MWYRRRTELTEEVIVAVGAEPHLWDRLSTRVHVDDMEGVATILGVPPQILLEVLYEPCEDPGGERKVSN